MMDPGSEEFVVQADRISVQYLIRYYRSDVTLRQTLLSAIASRMSNRDRSRPAARHWAIRDVSFGLRVGEVVGFIGRNGSGKTTLLQTVAGVFLPDRGRLTRRGQISCLLSLGAGFNGNLTGRENVYLNGAVLGVSRQVIDETLDEVIAFSDLGKFMDAPVRTYSAGMRSRLGFSIAMLVDPDVVILDEVIRAGDAAFRAKAGNILDRFREREKAVLIASHSMDLIRAQCDRVIWLDRGRIAMQGKPDVVTRAYLEESRHEKDRLGAE